MSHTKHRPYYSSMLESFCYSSIRCECGNWVYLHNEELEALKEQRVPLCDYKTVLKQRDTLVFATHSMSKILFDGRIKPATYTLYDVLNTVLMFRGKS